MVLRRIKVLYYKRNLLTVKEVVFIINILIYKFNLKCSIHMQRNQPTIYISSKSMTKIQPYIIPYICNSMRYKLYIKE